MESALRNFDKRQKTVRRKHARMARGYRNTLDKRGLIRQVPDNKIPAVALRLLVLVTLAFIGFKVLLLAGLGPETYQERVGRLAGGSGFERAGAAIMQIDPATGWLARQAGPLFD